MLCALVDELDAIATEAAVEAEPDEPDKYDDDEGRLRGTWGGGAISWRSRCPQYN